MSARIAASDLRVGDRLIVRGNRRRRTRIETVSRILRTPAVDPMPAAIFVEVRGGWSQEQYAPSDLLEVER